MWHAWAHDRFGPEAEQRLAAVLGVSLADAGGKLEARPDAGGAVSLARIFALLSSVQALQEISVDVSKIVLVRNDRTAVV